MYYETTKRGVCRNTGNVVKLYCDVLKINKNDADQIAYKNNSYLLPTEKLECLKKCILSTLSKTEAEVIFQKYKLYIGRRAKKVLLAELGIDQKEYSEIAEKAIKKLAKANLPAILCAPSGWSSSESERKAREYIKLIQRLREQEGDSREVFEAFEKLNDLTRVSRHFIGLISPCPIFDLTPTHELNLSVRAYNCLHRQGVDTIFDISLYGTGIYLFRNMGRNSTNEIIRTVQEKYPWFCS